MKSSILNISAMSGDNNQIITDKFYLMYKLLSTVGREKEGQQYLTKAMKIL